MAKLSIHRYPPSHAVDDQCVVAVYDSAPVANDAVERLLDGGLPPEMVSLVSPSNPHLTEDFEELQYGDDAKQDIALGAGFGGLVGLLAGATVLAVSGLGLIFIAGPIAAGLTGTIVGAFLGALQGWGVHSDHIEKYEEMVKAGKTLLIAHGPPRDVALAQKILEATEAEEMHLHAKTEAEEVDE